MKEEYSDLRHVIYVDDKELKLFRQCVVRVGQVVNMCIKGELSF